MEGYEGRRCLVTGGTQGIGLAIALAFAEGGAHVLVCSRSEPDLPTPGRGRLAWVAADLATRDGRAGLVDAAADRFDGALDVLVNNAGMNINRATVDLTDEDLDRVLDLDLRAVVALCRDAHPLLLAGDAPAIVNVSSIAGAQYVPAGVAYAIAKAGVDQLTRHLAVEWATAHYAEGYNQRAFVNFIRQDFATALEDLERALELAPDHVAAMAGQALTLMSLGRVELGQSVLRKALELHPWLPERHMLIEKAGEDL